MVTGNVFVNNGARLTVTAGGTVGGTGSNFIGGDGTTASTGSVLVQNGGTWSTRTTYLGYLAAGSGAVTLTGAGSTMTVANTFGIGRSGTGSLLIENGADATALLSFSIGHEAGSLGTMTIDGAGSTFIMSGTSGILGRNGDGVLTLSNGGAYKASSHTLLVGSVLIGVGVINIGAAANAPAQAAGILDSDVSGGTGSATLQINTTATAASPFHLTRDGTSSGTAMNLGGTLQLVHTAGTTVATGTSTRTGTTTINGGTFIADGALGSGAISVASGGTLAGSGSFTGALSLSGTIAPGNSPGTLTTGAQTWNGGGHYLWEIADASGAPGTGYDLLSISGALAVNASPASKFTIDVTSLAPGNVAGAATHFDPSLNYSFTLASTSDGVSGFDADAFAITTSAFANGFTGTWSVAVSGGDLKLNYAAPSAVPEPSTYAALFGATALAAAVLHRRRMRTT